MTKWPWIERRFNFDYPPSKFPDLLERLRGTPARIAGRIARLDPAVLTQRDGKGWSIQENVGHLADVEALWLGRLDDYDNAADTLRPADMSGRRTHEAGHNDRTMESVLDSFRQARARLVSRLEQLAPDRYGQTAHHPRLDQPMRIVDLVHFAAEHDDYHLARISELVRNLDEHAQAAPAPDPGLPLPYGRGSVCGHGAAAECADAAAKPHPGPINLDAQSGYDLWATVYDEELNPLVVLEEPVVREWIADPRGLRVADVGCGTGRHSIWLAERGADVTAYDASAGMMAKAREKLIGHGVHFHEHTLPAPLPVNDGTFDVVFLALVADHLAELEPTLRDLRRVLKPEGMLIFTVLHPAMNLRGLTARFTDPQSGSEVRVAAFEHTYADYVSAALNAGLTMEQIIERRADEALARIAPRAQKYIGWPMLLAMCLRRSP